MEPERPTPEPAQTESKHPLHQVTPLSKYLAMALFVILPFVGGYIGYTYAPEKTLVVETNVAGEVERQALRESDSLEVSENGVAGVEEILPTKYNDTDITPMFTDGDEMYFKTQSYSSKPVQIISYDTISKTFAEKGIYLDYAGGDKVSPGNRFVAKVSGNNFNQVEELAIVDIKNGTTVQSIELSNEETFVSGVCGYAGPTYDLEWTESSTLTYGVYDPEHEDECSADLIEYRELGVTSVN